jgi:hypothetical protein
MSLDKAFSLMTQPQQQYYTAGILVCGGPGDKVMPGTTVARATATSPAAEAFINKAFRIERSQPESTFARADDPAQSPDRSILATVGFGEPKGFPFIDRNARKLPRTSRKPGHV